MCDNWLPAKPTPSIAGSVRATDIDRDQTADRLRDSYSRGAISKAEYDIRLDTTFAAETVASLQSLVRDLPVYRPTVSVPTVTVQRRPSFKPAGWRIAGALLPAAVPAALLWYGATSNGFAVYPGTAQVTAAAGGVVTAIFWAIWFALFTCLSVVPAIGRYRRELARRN
jgi:hypothetical protein